MPENQPQMPISMYVDHPVPMIAPPPYKFEGIDSFSYLLGTKEEGKVTAEHFISKFLNGPLGSSNGKHRYSVPTNGTRPLLTFSSIRKSAAELFPDVIISYLEVALQIPVIITNAEDGSSFGNNFYMPVLFIDGLDTDSQNPTSIDSRHATSPIVIGRELYGLPKIPAAIDIQFSGLQLNSSEVNFYDKKVISVSGQVADDGTLGDRAFDKKQRRSLAEEMFGEMEPNDDETFGITKDRLNARIDLRHAGLPKSLIGLRQFRNPGNFVEAAGRAIIESPYEITGGDPRPMGNQVKIEFSAELAAALIMKEEYVVDRSATNGVIYLDAASTFGEPTTTVVQPVPDEQ